VRRRTLAGYLRTINYRRYPVTDIKPDTSLYTDLPSRLRAMALVLEGPRGRLQYRHCGSKDGSWSNCDEAGLRDARRAEKAVFEHSEYRLKPAPPAKLYVDLDGEGRPAHTYASPMAPMPGTTLVTYVLENPDAND